MSESKTDEGPDDIRTSAIETLGLSPKREKLEGVRRRAIEFNVRGGTAGVSNLDETTHTENPHMKDDAEIEAAMKTVKRVLERYGRLKVSVEPEPYSNDNKVEVSLVIDDEEVLSGSSSYRARDDDLSWV